MNRDIEQYQDSFQKSVKQFPDLELAKMRAARLRWKTINHLDKYLIEFESNFIKSGGKVIWAKDMDEVTTAVDNILKKGNVNSMLYNSGRHKGELSIGESLQNGVLQVTDLHDTPVNIPTPGQFIADANPSIKNNSHEKDYTGIHDSKKNDAELHVNQLSKIYRHDFLKENAGITTAQFFIADPGAIVIGDNSGSSIITAGIPRISIILAPIDRIAPSFSELDLMLSLYATFRHGNQRHTYNTIITGPRMANDKDGPEELYIVLIDNGRSNILAREPQRRILSCIECEACLPASAIYKTVGGKSYPGPAKAVGIPLAFGPEKYKYLSDLATMDGSGSEACPVKISFPRLTLENRKLFVEQGFGSQNEKWYYYAWKKTMLKRDIMSWTGIDARKKVLQLYYKKSAEGLRSWPQQKGKSFNQQWRDKSNINRSHLKIGF